MHGREGLHCDVVVPTSFDQQFVLVPARKSRRAKYWDKHDYDVRDGLGKVVGRIMLHLQAPKGQPWFWTITAREIPPSVYNRGYSSTRERGDGGF